MMSLSIHAISAIGPLAQTASGAGVPEPTATTVPSCDTLADYRKIVEIAGDRILNVPELVRWKLITNLVAIPKETLRCLVKQGRPILAPPVLNDQIGRARPGSASQAYLIHLSRRERRECTETSGPCIEAKVSKGKPAKERSFHYTWDLPRTWWVKASEHPSHNGFIASMRQAGFKPSERIGDLEVIQYNDETLDVYVRWYFEAPPYGTWVVTDTFTSYEGVLQGSSVDFQRNISFSYSNAVSSSAVSTGDLGRADDKTPPLPTPPSIPMRPNPTDIADAFDHLIAPQIRAQRYTDAELFARTGRFRVVTLIRRPEDYKSQVQDSKGTRVVYVATQSCGLCHMMEYTLERTAEEAGAQGLPVRFFYYEIDAEVPLEQWRTEIDRRKQMIGVDQIPTIIIYREGQEPVVATRFVDPNEGVKFIAPRIGLKTPPPPAHEASPAH